jgi:hypothetical protein
MKKGVGAGSISQRYGSGHPDPHQNVMDPQHWHKAYELGFSNTLIYGREWPVCVSMDDIWFRKPVEIGAMLHFSSQICYVQDNRVQTRVAAEVRDADNFRKPLQSSKTMKIKSVPIVQARNCLFSRILHALLLIV